MTPPLRDLDRNSIEHYVGGEIIFPTIEGARYLVKGAVSDLYFEDGWLIARVMIKATAEGDFSDANAITAWSPLNRGVEEVVLAPTAFMDDQLTLSFPALQKGSLALLKRL